MLADRHPVHEFLQRCQDLKVLVIGDLMVDRYLWGKVERISPEAPVPVVDIYKEENRPGGAANVALNVHALGAMPALCGVVGDDEPGENLIALAQEQGFDSSLIWRSPSRRTTVKVRVIGNQQQVLRVDKEDREYLPADERAQFLGNLLPRLPEYDVVIIEDYDKGLLHPDLIGEVMAAALAADVPVMVDPKFRQFWAYSHCTLFKPNLKELNEGLGYRLDKSQPDSLLPAIAGLRQKMPHGYSLITLSEAGMLLVDPGMEPYHVPAHYRDIVDVSGAGDTVISVMSLGMAAGLDPRIATRYANLAGGLVCEEVGVVPIQREKWLREAERLL